MAVNMIAALVLSAVFFIRCPGAAECAAAEGGCAPIFELPRASVTYGDDEPTLTIALFVDFESAASRQVFSEVTEVVESLSVRARVNLYHAPEGGCTSASDSVHSFRCMAARAVECAEQQRPGSGIYAAGAVFDLQWAGDTSRRADVLMEAVSSQRSSPEVLRGCIDNHAGIAALVASHAAWAADRGLSRAPGGFLVVADAGRVMPFGAWLTKGALDLAARELVDDGV
jgi:hypothetical protein